MKENQNLHSLFITIILIITGIISPNNGVDDSVNKQPHQMLHSAFIIIVSAIFVYLVWTAIENYKELSKTN